MARIVRINPVRQPNAFDFAFNRLFDDTWRSVFAPENTNNGNQSDYRLAIDVAEADNSYFVSASLPGIDPSNINIHIEDDVLSIEAEVPQAAIDLENSRTLVQERRYGKFSRSIRLPQAVDGDNVDATYANGVLELNLPKLPENQPKQIQVKALAK